jgi:hypothetical protein
LIGSTIADLPVRLAANGPSGPIVVMIGRVFAEFRENTLREEFPPASQAQAQAQ